MIDNFVFSDGDIFSGKHRKMIFNVAPIRFFEGLYCFDVHLNEITRTSHRTYRHLNSLSAKQERDAFVKWAFGGE